MTRPVTAPRLPRGYAFPIAELQAIQRWADRHGVCLTIELDRCLDGEEYEEVLALLGPKGPRQRWNLWRSAEHLVVEPAIGPTVRYARLADVLVALRV